MRTLVLGAGVIGTTTAYYLTRLGEEVTLVDRRSAAGLETSFANGGLITPGMSDPWAAPGLPLKLLKWLGREDAPFLLRLKALPGLTSWGLRFLANCTERHWRQNAGVVLRIAEYSRDALDELTDELTLDFDRGDGGTLMVFRDEESMRATRRAADLLSDLGVDCRGLDAGACAQTEPALEAIVDRLKGGLIFPGDRHGDAFKFTSAVSDLCRQAGVDIHFDVNIESIEARGNEITGVVTDRGVMTADRYVVALGSYSAPMVQPLGLALPIQPVKGYSMTLDVAGWNGAPRVPVIDYGRKLGVTPLGHRLRVAGTAELNGFDLSASPRRGAVLIKALSDVYPAVRVPDDIEIWAGLRPVTPDGPPILGPTAFGNLYLNCGQGHLGWTMACGSARVLADLIAGRQPAISLEGLLLDRFSR